MVRRSCLVYSIPYGNPVLLALRWIATLRLDGVFCPFRPHSIRCYIIRLVV